MFGFLKRRQPKAINHLQLPHGTNLLLHNANGETIKLTLSGDASVNLARRIQVRSAPRGQDRYATFMFATRADQQVGDLQAAYARAITTVGPGDLIYLYRPQAKGVTRPFKVSSVEVI